MLLFIWLDHPVYFSGRPTRTRAPLAPLSPLPLCSAGSARMVHVARARRFRAAASRAPLTGRQGPPCSCPASSTHQPRCSTPTAPLPHPPPLKKEPDDDDAPRTPFPSSVLTLSTPRQTSSPSDRPALRAPFRRPNFGRSTATVHLLGEPPTEPFPRQSRPHLTSLSPSPWCRAWAPSLVTKVPLHRR
jgi:hypothetical protein